MARIEFDVDSSAPPERVVAGLTDFTERRPDIWPELNRKIYQVHQVGETWADVTEGNSKSIWARERYDWSKPGAVTWTVQESGFCAPGSFVSADLRPREDGGSRIHVTWQREPTSALGRFVVLMIRLTKGKPVRSSLSKGLRNIERGRA